MEKVLQIFEDYACGLASRNDFAAAMDAAAEVADAGVVAAAAAAAADVRSLYIAGACKDYAASRAAYIEAKRQPIEVARASWAAQAAQAANRASAAHDSWVGNPARVALHACF